MNRGSPRKLSQMRRDGQIDECRIPRRNCLVEALERIVQPAGVPVKNRPPARQLQHRVELEPWGRRRGRVPRHDQHRH